MGLDVYLYRYDDFASTRGREEEAETFSETVWNRVMAGREYKDLTDAEKDEARGEVKSRNLAVGLDEHGSANDAERVEVNIDSSRYPDHYFKIGYLRSSYNSGGFNSIARRACGMDLYDVFAPGDEYYVKPDWHAARTRAAALVESLRSAHKYLCDTVAGNVFAEASRANADDALATFLRHQKKRDGHGGQYSCGEGSFYLDEPLRVLAAIPGIDVLGVACVHLVYESSDESRQWYVQAAEITLEMIDYVLAQPDRDKYVLHWSS